ncbi:CU044_5270 family protein [Cellulomonas sp. Marseille-Q8402]
MTQDHDEREAERLARAEVAALRDLLDAHGLGAPDAPPAAGRAEDDGAIAAILGRGGDVDAAGEAGDDASGAPVVPLRRPATRRPARRRWAVAAGVAAAAVAGVSIALLPPQGAPRAVAVGSPPMLAYPVPPAELASAAVEPARDTLLTLADAAAAQTDPEAAGTVQHVLSQSWLSSTTATGDGGADTTIDPTVRETWLSADGSLVAAEWRGAELRADGMLEPVDTAPEEAAVDRIPAGTDDPDRAADLSLEPAVLRGQLLELAGGDPIGCGPGTADGAWCVYQGLTVLDAYVLPSALESAVWSVLAEEPGVGLVGEVTDRAGRRAVGVSVPAGAPDVDPVVRVLLLDAETGRLSGREEVTLSSPAMDITEPTVTTFRYELAADRVAEVGWAGRG